MATRDADAGSRSRHEYEIRVSGHLGDSLQLAFPQLTARPFGGDTLLEGELTDRAALHAVLTQIESLGLELLELRRRRDSTEGMDER